ncbi:MAG: DUF4060 family protein [Vibrio sp.]
MLTRKITGDKTFEHILVAHMAMDEHVSRHGENSFVGKPCMYSVRYRDKSHAVEVTTNRKQLTAVVITGKRSLNKVCNH